MKLTNIPSITWSRVLTALGDFAFIILLFALYVISGGISLRGDLAAHPATNTTFLAVGAAIASFIRSTPDTPRKSVMDQDDLIAIRRKMDKHLKNTYLKKVQAPLGVNPVLVCWMELN